MLFGILISLFEKGEEMLIPQDQQLVLVYLLEALRLVERPLAVLLLVELRLEVQWSVLSLVPKWVALRWE